MSILQAKFDYNAKKIKGYLVKKIFPQEVPPKQPGRVEAATKLDTRKYRKREPNKHPPEGDPFWIFECRIGNIEENAKEVLVQELISAIDVALSEKWSECFVEIVAKPAKNLKSSEKK